MPRQHMPIPSFDPVPKSRERRGHDGIVPDAGKASGLLLKRANRDVGAQQAGEADQRARAIVLAFVEPGTGRERGLVEAPPGEAA